MAKSPTRSRRNQTPTDADRRSARPADWTGPLAGWRRGLQAALALSVALAAVASILVFLRIDMSDDHASHFDAAGLGHLAALAGIAALAAVATVRGRGGMALGFACAAPCLWLLSRLAFLGLGDGQGMRAGEPLPGQELLTYLPYLLGANLLLVLALVLTSPATEGDA